MKEDVTVDSIVSEVPAKKSSPYFLKNAPAVLKSESKNETCKFVPKPELPQNDSPADDSSDDPDDRRVREQIAALNSEFFKLTKRQFEIMRENMNLQVAIFKIDWDYSSEFDDFISQFIGKKSASLERKHSANEREYETIEARLKSIESRISELRASIKK
jgi:predicted RNase H-like nuclease (RuvC/YqgF family)